MTISPLFLIKENMKNTKHLSRVLQNNSIGLHRVLFNPENVEHREIYARFMNGEGWSKKITFHVESPHTTVPSTVTSKVMNYFLKKELEQLS